MKATQLYTQVKEELLQAVNSRKTVGGAGITPEDVSKFMGTVSALNAVGRYDTTVTVNGFPYPISDYLVDGTLGATLLWPREVLLPGGELYSRKSIRDKYDIEGEVLNPPEFLEVQERILAKFRKAVHAQPVAEFIGSKDYGPCDLISGDMVAVSDLMHIRALPFSITISDDVYEKEYFTYPLAAVIKAVVANMVTDIISKG